MRVKRTIREFIKNKFGYDIVRYTPRLHPLARRSKLLESYDIDVVLDVGANLGQYGMDMRELGYKGRLISFEPLGDVFKKLEANTRADELWEVYSFALGNTDGKSIINIAGNTDSSSILDMLPTHLKFAPMSKYIGKDEIEVRTLDTLFETLALSEANIYLKIDTQGFEENVLKGAENSLPLIDTIQLEMSLVPLYTDEILFDEMYQILFQKGYRLVSVETGFLDRETGQMLQLDGIFHRFDADGS